MTITVIHNCLHNCHFIAFHDINKNDFWTIPAQIVIIISEKMKAENYFINNGHSKGLPIILAFLIGLITGVSFGVNLQSSPEIEAVVEWEEKIEGPNIEKIQNLRTENPEEPAIEKYLRKVLIEDWKTPLNPVPPELKLNLPISQPFIQGQGDTI